MCLAYLYCILLYHLIMPHLFPSYPIIITIPHGLRPAAH